MSKYITLTILFYEILIMIIKKMDDKKNQKYVKLNEKEKNEKLIEWLNKKREQKLKYEKKLKKINEENEKKVFDFINLFLS